MSPAAPTAHGHRPLDIIVPIYRNAELVRACVESLLEHLHEVAERSPRLVLVNDSPDDEPVGRLLDVFAAGPERGRIHLLVNEKNLGFVGAVNRGLSMAVKDGRDVLLVNSDTVTFEGTLRTLLDAASEDPQIGFACPRSNNASICSLPHFYGGRPPGPAESHARWKSLAASMPRWHFAPTAVGFYMYIAHSVVANHGGLRTDFGAGYEEENDLVMRAGKVGQRAIIVNHAFAYHAGSASFSLTDIDLDQHRHANHLKLLALHPEFTSLVHRYEGSAHVRAERALSGLLPDAQGRIRLVFDLTGLGMHHNGTNEFAIAVVRRLVERWSHRFRVAGVGSADSFKFHHLHDLEGLHREEPGAPGLHAIAVRMGQPFDLHHVNVLESLAPINIVAMLDTISEDCGPLAAEGHFLDLWDHVAAHSNALLFISRFAQQQFCTRHPAAIGRLQMAMLLSTQLEEYRAKPLTDTPGQHVLVLGNHFPHKASEPAARRLAAVNPTLQFVVLGGETGQRGNVTGYRSGTLDNAKMDALFAQASVVVLPSHVEGFGFGLMHALAVGKPIVARRIPATEEILSLLDDVEGVFLFDTDADMPDALERALRSPGSHAKTTRGPGWADWGDAVAEVCLKAHAQPDLFSQLRSRIVAGDLMRRALQAAQHGAAQARSAPATQAAEAPRATPVASLQDLLSQDGRHFIETAYATLLQRPADDSGLAFYMAQLGAGMNKRQVVRALATSPEGRSRAVDMPGLAALIADTSMHRSLIKRLLQR